MTYQKLVYLKYKKGIPTNKLLERFPNQLERVSEVALLDLPEELLKQVVEQGDHFDRLMGLKKKFKKFLLKKHL